MDYHINNIGKTPLVRLSKFEQENNIKCHIFAKLEYDNPFGSIKDRSALKMILKATQKYPNNANLHFVEASSGNLGISVSAICNILGYSSTIIMPENMSQKRKDLINYYGAKLILSKEENEMSGCIEIAKQLVNTNKKYIYLDQFNNSSNVDAHIDTGREIYYQLKKNVDYVICGIGSGGTITGIGKFLCQFGCKLIGVEPSASPIITKGYAGKHNIPGIGAGFIPEILNLSLIDKTIAVSDKEALEECEIIKRTENLFIGISSGAVIAACKHFCLENEIDNKNIVLIFADGESRYK